MLNPGPTISPGGSPMAENLSSPNLNLADRSALAELRRSVAEVLRILSVRRWRFFVPFCVLTTLASLLSLYVPRRYVASTMFERRDDPVLVNLPRSQGSGAFEMFRRSLVQDMSSPPLLEEVVRRCGAVAGIPRSTATAELSSAQRAALDDAVARVAAGLEVVLHEQSAYHDLIEVKYTTHDGRHMAALLDEVRDGYIRMTQVRINKILRQTKDWFEQERLKRQNLVDALEEDFIRFKTAHLGVDPLDPDALFSQLTTLRADLLDLERRGKEWQTQIDGRREFLLGASPSGPIAFPGNLAAPLGLQPVGRSAESHRLTAESRTLESRIDELQSARGMTEQHPDILALRRRAQRITEDLQRQEQLDVHSLSVNGIAPWGEGLSATDGADAPWLAARATTESEIKVLVRLLASNEDEVRQSQEKMAQYETLQRDALHHRKEFSTRQQEVDRAREELILYQGYADQVGRILAAEDSQRGILFERIRPAAGSHVPASPRASTVAVLVLFAGLVAGILAVLLSELFDRTLRTREQIIKEFGLPILESVGEILTAATRRRRLFFRLVWAPVCTVVLLGGVATCGLAACLSLQNKDLYERTFSFPRSVLPPWLAAGFGTDSAPTAYREGRQG